MATRVIDWSATSKAVNDNFAKTGKWGNLADFYVYKDDGTTAPTQPSTPPTSTVKQLTAGTGSDSLILKISQDAYNGSAQYTVKVDGKQIGGTFTVSDAASHKAGAFDTLTLKGDWTAGVHKVEVNFLNDAWGGTAATDRNLYVESASYNGLPVTGAVKALSTTGVQSFNFTEATAGGPVVTPPTGQLDLPPTKVIWAESFDNGLGKLGHAWGHYDTSTKGQVTVSGFASDNYQVNGGIMVKPAGASAGDGYGLYNFTLKMSGDGPGPFAALWPATDRWPGPELDVVEQQPGGKPYSTIHWKAADGGDGYKPYMLGDVNTREVHTYSINWQQEKIEFFVDGKLKATATDHIPKDFAHGGENSAAGVGFQASWTPETQHGVNQSVTVYDVSYHQVIG